MESPEMILMGDRKKVGMDQIAIALVIMENSLCFFSSVLLFSLTRFEERFNANIWFNLQKSILGVPTKLPNFCF